jgi:chemotaxis signal transduction protein
MATAKALRLQLSATQSVVVALHEMTAVVEDVIPIYVPRAPAHCRYLVAWQGQLLPTFDPLEWCGIAAAKGKGEAAQFHAILTYETGDANGFGYGCIALRSFPNALDVDDVNACPLPAPRWESIARSCFLDGEDIIPILDLAAMFGRPMDEASAATADRIEAIAA